MRAVLLVVRWLAFGLWLLSGAAASAADAAFSLGASVNYSTGTYGGSTATSITSMPLLAKYEGDDWVWKLTVPYLSITGPGGVVPGVGRVGGSSTAISTQQGLGDTVLAGTYTSHYDTARKFGIDLTGKVKFATGNADAGLGTGANDYTALVELYQGLGRHTLFGGLAYTAMGSTATFKPNNVYSLLIGDTFKVDDRSSLGLSYDARERLMPSTFPISELTAFVSRKHGTRWKSQFYILRGFDYGSPDWGAGAMLYYGF